MPNDIPQGRYGLITWVEFADRWQNAGLAHRFGLLLIALGVIAAVIAGVLTATGMGWWSLIAWGVAICLVVVGNYIRVRALRRYLGLR